MFLEWTHFRCSQIDLQDQDLQVASWQVLVGHTAMDLVALGQRADKEQRAAEEPSIAEHSRAG